MKDKSQGDFLKFLRQSVSEELAKMGHIKRVPIKDSPTFKLDEINFRPDEDPVFSVEGLADIGYDNHTSDPESFLSRHFRKPFHQIDPSLVKAFTDGQDIKKSLY
jgi:hypothetical protein